MALRQSCTRGGGALSPWVCPYAWLLVLLLMQPTGGSIERLPGVYVCTNLPAKGLRTVRVVPGAVGDNVNLVMMRIPPTQTQ